MDGLAKPFCSGLSVNGLLALRHVGLKPKGLVLGASVWALSAANDSMRRSFLYRNLTIAVAQALRAALDRLRAEAVEHGVEGVVGVKLTIKRWERESSISAGMLEFVALGTSVVRDGVVPPKEPFVTNLNAVHAASLLKAGCRPVDLAVGIAVAQRPSLEKNVDRFGTMPGTGQQNSEFFTGQRLDLTQAVASMRDYALDQMGREALRSDVDGIVGVQITQEKVDLGGLVVVCIAVGTSVLGRVVPAEVGLTISLDAAKE